MYMHARIGRFQGTQDAQIRFAGEARVDASLQANLGRTSLPCLERALDDFRDIE